MNEDKYKETFSNNLKWFMALQQLNQNDIAKITGVSQQSVSNWLNSKQIPRMAVIDKLTIFFDISKSDLLDEENEKNGDARSIFVDNFKRIMKERHKKPAQIARDLKLPLSTVAGWANGSSYPRVDSMQRLADYLNVRLNELVIEHKYSIDYKIRKVLSFISYANENQIDDILSVIDAFEKKRD